MPSLSKNKLILWKLAGVGDIYIKRNRKAKRLTIRVKPSGQLLVTVPSLLPLQLAKLFIKEKQAWIIEKLIEVEKTKENKLVLSGYKTREHVLQFRATKNTRVKVTYENQTISINHPEGIDSQSNELQAIAKEAIISTYRKEANQILPERVRLLAQKHNLKYNTLRIKNITSRWGSCSNRDNINLSLFLMKLPDELIDYVILHELSHTIHKNHSPLFWRYLDNLVGDAKSLSKQMKKYRTGI
jgi:hypothetical protein